MADFTAFPLTLFWCKRDVSLWFMREKDGMIELPQRARLSDRCLAGQALSVESGLLQDTHLSSQVKPAVHLRAEAAGPLKRRDLILISSRSLFVWCLNNMWIMCYLRYCAVSKQKRPMFRFNGVQQNMKVVIIYLPSCHSKPVSVKKKWTHFLTQTYPS